MSTMNVFSYTYNPVAHTRENFSNRYMFGFNGMEKDNEAKGLGNSLDFGARIYDSRLGRWLSTDPMGKAQPGWSAYKAFLDNPIIYIDPDGNTEYEILVLYKNGVRQQPIFRIVDDDRVMTDGVKHPKERNNTQWEENNYYSFATVKISHEDAEGNVTDGGSYFVIYADEKNPLYTEGVYFGGDDYGETRFDGNFLGLGSSQPGGWHLVNESGLPGAEPTKYQATESAEQIKIDKILGAFKAKGKGAKPQPGVGPNVPKVVSNGKEITKTVTERSVEGDSTTYSIPVKIPNERGSDGTRKDTTVHNNKKEELKKSNPGAIQK